VSRAAAALTAALLVSAALGAAGAGAAGDCAWAKHSKRVVKKVRREGEVRRVKLTKHWWTCVPVLATPNPLPPVPAPIVPAPPPTQTEPTPEPTASALGVKAVEWSYTLSRPEVPAGEVIVQLNNMGEDPHDLNIRLQDSEGTPLRVPIAPSRQQVSKRFTLPAGTYRLWCDLDEHDERGMHATLVVGGP
jgi:plastocyanin